MRKRGSLAVTIGLAAIMTLSLSVSCTKKPVQQEEALTPEVVQPEQKPSGIGETARTLPTTAAVQEESISEAAKEREREKEALAFVNEDIYFEYDRYDLSAKAREILADKAYFLRENPALKIRIEGHCDDRGTNEYNLALGERRANSARQYLMNLGVRSDRISTVSYGEEQPLDPGQNEEAWARNRRGHFVIVSR
jgi:peptidoglycan-associated lipoprotein